MKKLHTHFPTRGHHGAVRCGLSEPSGVAPLPRMHGAGALGLALLLLMPPKAAAAPEPKTPAPSACPERWAAE
eukprot:825454-Prymnesium_polylepis.1